MVLQKVGKVVCAHCGSEKPTLVHVGVKCENCGSFESKAVVMPVGAPYDPPSHISRRPHAIDRRQRRPL